MRRGVEVRATRPEDFPGIVRLSRDIYGTAAAWREELLASHLEVFPEGQMVAVTDAAGDGAVIGMAASLIVLWDDYDIHDAWRDFTEGGTFRNHDPESGRTLYGAEVMVAPDWRGKGVGSQLYDARWHLVTRLGLLRIRAGSRLRGYHKVAHVMDARQYVRAVIRKERFDPTLSFQLRRGFRVIGVVSGYLKLDPESLGFAAIIERLNPAVAGKGDDRAQREWAARWS